MILIEIEYPDGSIARWALSDEDNRVTLIENMLGTPDTHKL